MAAGLPPARLPAVADHEGARLVGQQVLRLLFQAPEFLSAAPLAVAAQHGSSSASEGRHRVLGRRSGSA